MEAGQLPPDGAGEGSRVGRGVRIEKCLKGAAGVAKRGKRCSSGRPGGKAVRLCGLLNGARGHGGGGCVVGRGQLYTPTRRGGPEGHRGGVIAAVFVVVRCG